MEDETLIDLEEDNLNIAIEEEQNEEIKIDKVDRIVENDYNKLQNQPKINNITLINNKTLDDLGVQEKGDYADTRITNTELEEIFNDW